jgi:hypothetical protein
MSAYLWFGGMMSLTILQFWLWRGTRSRFGLAATILSGLCAAIWGLLVAANLSAGCTPWAPAEVEFKQGMTLCPGQSAKGTFTIPNTDDEAEKPRPL